MYHKRRYEFWKYEFNGYDHKDNYRPDRVSRIKRRNLKKIDDKRVRRLERRFLRHETNILELVSFNY